LETIFHLVVTFYNVPLLFTNASLQDQFTSVNTGAAEVSACFTKAKAQLFLIEQGCQIFLGTTYQNGKKYTKVTTKYTESP
jgi:hypothetical protein